MTELLRKLLESYDGVTPPMLVQTDLSAARVPSYAVACKGEKVTGEDILGRRSYLATFAFYLRRAAAAEQDRQAAHGFLRGLGEWLAAQGPIAVGNRCLTRIEVGTELLQEAYDDGTAVWSMEIRLLLQE